MNINLDKNRIMKKYLVIGGHGFIGSYFCKRLIANGCKDFDIYDINEPNGDPSPEVIKFRKSVLPKSISLENIKNTEYEYCVHFGSYAGIRSKRNPLDYISNNVYALQELIKILNVVKFVYISSSSVLGDVETPYSLSKKIAENIVSTIPESLIVRPFTVYGKNGRPEMFITKLINNPKVTVNGDPTKIKRRFTYVEDLIDCILDCIDDTGVVNAIGGHVYSLKNLLDIFGNKYDQVEQDPSDFTKQTFNKSDRDYLCRTMIEDVKEQLK